MHVYKLVLIRHGESFWNRDNLFTGWTDVGLTENGVKEVVDGAKLLKEEGYEFDIAFISFLKRAKETLDIVLEEMGITDLPVESSWRLNERHYGALQGFNKADMSEYCGADTVHSWRRGYDADIPKLNKLDPRYPGNDPLYDDVPEEDLPVAECLKNTVERFLPYWHEAIAPRIKEGKRVLISAHGNSLRALVKYLDEVSDEDIPGLNIPTGIPLVYELDEDLKPIKHYYLGDPEAAKKAAEAVAQQAKGK